MLIFAPKPVREIYKIRKKIHEETKNMTIEERVKYANERGREIAKSFGLDTKFVDKAE
jgi:hypothetical protein